MRTEEIASALLDAAVDSGSWQSALLELAHSCNAQVGSMVLVDKATGAGKGYCLGIDDKWSSIFVRRQAHHVALGSAVVRPGAVFTDRMVIDRREFERSYFFEAWAEPAKQTEYAGVAVLNDADRFVFVGLSRGPRRGAFDPAELGNLQALAADIRRAARVWVALGADEDSRRTLEAAFDSLAHAVFLTDGSAQARYMNAAAAALLACDQGLAIRNGKIVCGQAAKTKLLHALITSAAQQKGPEGASRMKLAASDDGLPLTLLVCPLTAPPERIPPRADVMLIAIGPGTMTEGQVNQIRAYFGLTPVEAQLTFHIIKGAGLKAAAHALNIAPSTARTHLNHIFDKTGARSQAMLANLVSAGLLLKTQTQDKSSN